MKYARWCFLACAVTIVTACSRPLLSPPEGRACLDHWQIRARVALKTADHGSSFDLRWYQKNDVFSIEVSGPFGAGLTRLNGNMQGTRLETQGHEDFYEGAPSQVMQQLLNVNYPVDSLRYWVTGMPVPHQAARITTDTYGRIGLLEQFGWKVQLSRHRWQQGRWWPTSIWISNGRDNLRLRILDWDFEECIVSPHGS